MDININDILKNAGKIQEQVGAVQERLGGVRVTGSSGGGMVEIDLNGKLEALAVRIDPEIFSDGDRELVQGLIVAAFADGQEKAKQAAARELGAGLFGAGGIPGFPGAGLA